MDYHSRLKTLARAALIRARGDITKAMERIDADIIKSNDIELERSLTADWRHYALRALLNRNRSDLIEERRLPQQTIQAAPAADLSCAPSTWAHRRVQQMEKRARNYLNEYLINGEPIGDLTAETVLMKADSHERDARFMRLMASGVPPTGRIRDYVSAEEANERWGMAREQPSLYQFNDPRADRLLKVLMRGRPLKPDEYQATQQRVRELESLDTQTAWDSFELDALARVMSEYEADV